VHVDHVVVAEPVAAPHLFEEEPAFEHPLGPGRQRVQDVELGARQVHQFLVHSHLARRGLDHQCTEAPWTVGRGAVLAWSSQHGLHACAELAGGEGLDHIVIRPDRQPDNPVDLLPPRRQHEHVGVGERPQPPAHLDPIDAGEHEIQDDDVRVDAVGLLEAGLAVAHHPDVEPLTGQVGVQEVGDRGIVLHHQDLAPGVRRLAHGASDMSTNSPCQL